MGLGKDWRPLLDGPQNVRCHKCHKGMATASNIYDLSPTGIVTHLYYCTGCCWCQNVRYDPATPTKYMVISFLPPDKHGNIRKIKGTSKGRK